MTPTDAALQHVRSLLVAAGLDVEVGMRRSTTAAFPFVLVQVYDAQTFTFNGPVESHGVVNLKVLVVDRAETPGTAISTYARVHSALQASTGSNAFGQVLSCTRERELYTPNISGEDPYQERGGLYTVVAA